ncbi:hypothetical protein RvY_18706 [Ramazzottius varieornatus]|uniref:Uncharacterized protein n=1 Tax=Ramazzottius varieornatus TaxID=947166 RepID=A0A1D1W6R7_RAMVA|nr:hypothetical protein RvY_18706 [Ramazzottius varieornatus]
MTVAPIHDPPVAQIAAPSTAEPPAAVTADSAPQESAPGNGRRVPSQRTVVVKRKAQDAACNEKEQELKKPREARKKDRPAPGQVA